MVPSTLSVPSLFLAGLALSPHCALMCAPLQNLLLAGQTHRHGVVWLNLGRVAGYGAMGAVAGTLGAQLLRWLPAADWGSAVQASAGLVLILIGIVYLGPASPRCAAHMQHSAMPVTGSDALRLLLRGMAWAMLPCGLLYGLLFLAVVSGSGGQGGLLMTAFGVGTSPMLVLGGGLMQRLLQRRPLRRWAAVALIASGSLSLLAPQGPASMGLWCRSAVASIR